MSDDPRGWRVTTDEHGITVSHRPARTPAHRRRPRRPLDRVVLAVLILAWLLMASVDTYAPLFIACCLATGQLWGMRWLWRQYLEHRAPSMLDRPQPTTKAVIPLLVRLMLLPGAWRIVGHYNVRKAYAIRFMRRDMAARGQVAGSTGERIQALEADGDRLRACLLGEHIWKPGNRWCACKQQYRSAFQTDYADDPNQAMNNWLRQVAGR